MRQKCTSEVEFSFHFLMQAVLQMLSDNLPQHHLFGEVLRPHAQHAACLGTGAARYERRERRRYTRDNFRSTHPNPPSAANAISAAGTAPARICAVSTDATPRNMNTPSPPPPIAAAMVAVPMVVTVATRMPARMVGAASGNCTCRNICPLVIPIA